MSDAANEPESPARVVVAVLAAGAGSRFGGPTHKLRAALGGRTVAEVAIDAALRAGVGPVLVVTGATELELGDRPVRVVHNARWAEGQSTSLHAAVAEAGRAGAGALVVGLADQPFVEPEAWRRVATATAPIAIATYGGRRRNPVRLDRSVWPLLAAAVTGDEGARALARLRPDLVGEVPCPGSPVDIDTLEDLHRWQSRSSTSSP